jgi:hypothetical protein
MARILQHTSTGSCGWKLDQRLLLADELLYFYARTYTSTRPWFRRQAYAASLVQPGLYYKNDETDVLVENMLTNSQKATPLQALNYSVLVIMNTLVRDRAGVDRALSDIAADADAILRSDGIRAA